MKELVINGPVDAEQEIEKVRAFSAVGQSARDVDDRDHMEVLAGYDGEIEFGIRESQGLNNIWLSPEDSIALAKAIIQIAEKVIEKRG